MPSVKAIVDETSVKEFLIDKYETPLNIQFISGGQLSQAFSYSVGNDEYILKIRKDIEALNKEKEIFDKLSKYDSTIPIPKVFDSGLFAEKEDHSLFYCISEKCDGDISWKLDSGVLDILKSNMLEILLEIHQTDISETRGYGDWWVFKEASHTTWREFMIHYTKSKIDEARTFLKGQKEEIEFIDRLGKEID